MIFESLGLLLLLASIFLLPIAAVVGLVILHNRITDLTKQIDELKRHCDFSFSSYDKLMESLEIEINRRCSIIQQRQEQYLQQLQQQQQTTKPSDNYSKEQSTESSTENIPKPNIDINESIETKKETEELNSQQDSCTQKSSESIIKNEAEKESSNINKESINNEFVEKAERIVTESVHNQSANENIKEEATNKAKENIEELSKAEESISESSSEPDYVKESEATTKAQKVFEAIYKPDDFISKEPAPKAKEPLSFIQIFSWIGGFILLLGIIFWIKYALEQELLSPVMRIALGSLAGIGMWVAGVLLKKPNVKTTSDTLCACGLCTFYAIWFSAYYFYHLVSPAVSFTILSLVALASFATAIWKNAQYIGVLAQIIGFLTPVLFPSDNSQIWFILLYIAVINIAAVSSAIKRNWTNQLYLGLVFTFLSFLSVINTGSLLQIAVFPGVFALFYTLVAAKQDNKWLLNLSFVFTTIALIIIGIKNYNYHLEAIPLTMGFAGLFAVCFGLLSYFKKNNELAISTLIFTFISFVILATANSFKYLFVFAMIISAFFVFLSAKLKNKYLQIGSMILSTLGFIAVYFCQPNSLLDISHLPYLAGFSVIFMIFFVAIAYWQKNETLFINSIVFGIICFSFFKELAYLLSISSLFTLIFGIISYLFGKKHLQISSIVFSSISISLINLIGSQNINLVLSFGMAFILFYDYFAIKQKDGEILSANAISLVPSFIIFGIYSVLKGIGLAPYVDITLTIITWIASWNVLFMVIPYYFKNEFDYSKFYWITLSICNIFTGIIILTLCTTSYLSIYSGRVAFVLAFVYALFTERIFRWTALANGIQKLRLTALVCAPILFLTTAISLEFANEIKTIAFAIEGLGLIALWNILNINLLQYAGFLILGITAVRLLFNPYIADYYVKTALIFNWYLYTYIISAISMFSSALCWRKDSSKYFPTALNTVGGILLFALVNIEIANYFSNGVGLHFQFSGTIGEAAAYTIAWTICGAICMLCNYKNIPELQRVGIGLISLSVLKLFIADIWQLSSGLRVAVLFAVAIIMLAISFIYQQFKKNKS